MGEIVESGRFGLGPCVGPRLAFTLDLNRLQNEGFVVDTNSSYGQGLALRTPVVVFLAVVVDIASTASAAWMLPPMATRAPWGISCFSPLLSVVACRGLLKASLLDW